MGEDTRSHSELRTVDGTPVPLLGVAVKAEVLGAHAKVLVRQRYRNTEKKPVEAVYTFPLPADATLAAFAMACEGHRLEAEVQEREKAFRTYDDALVEGHGAALLEQERANVFTANVGNLLPNEETVVEVEYLQRLHADEGAIRWMLPTLVAPRYIPGAPKGDRTAGGWADPTDAVPDADRITPRIGEVAYGLKLELVFALAGGLDVECPSHPVTIAREDGRTRVSFASGEVALDRDVVVVARGVTEGPLAGVVAHREGPEPGYFGLTVVPDLFDPVRAAAPQNVVFVIDTSGSMEGLSIVEAKSALRLCLRHLREGDRFNVVEFNSTHRAFASAGVAFGEKTLQQADRWVESLRATGGTELLSPMLDAVKSAPDGVVVLLTDGQVGNERQILEEVLAARKGTRVYSFGIGTNVSDLLLRELAKQTGGGVEFIHPGERIDDKVVATFAKAVATRVTDLELKLVGLETGELAPSAFPALVDGEPWVVFGRYASPGRGRAELRGKLAGRPFALDVPVELPAESDRPAIRKLWASERIRDLESMEVTGRRAGAMKDRIVRLAIENGVSSPYTSFVVVEKREGARRASGQPEARFVPVNAPAGWAMFERSRGAPAGMPMPSMVPPPPPMSPMMHAPMSAPKPASRPRAAPAPARFVDASAITGKVMKDAGAGGLGGAAKGMLEKAKRMLKKEAPAEPPEAAYSMPMLADMDDLEAFATAEEEAAPKTGGADPVVALLGRQLASGLWDEAGKDDADVRKLRATGRALFELLEAGVTTSHALHGAQVRKAVEALLHLAARLAAREPKLVELALGVAWLAATGKRTRGAIEGVVKQQASLSGLEARFADPAALRVHVAQLRA